MLNVPWPTRAYTICTLEFAFEVRLLHGTYGYKIDELDMCGSLILPNPVIYIPSKRLLPVVNTADQTICRSCLCL